ncbi:uncharacterized protein LOC118185664 [Stegodyphus dumicola]|uniref:uncharacterized protein LOC118185664 n=1 Tax=Stegodyphus dumicola TaxID=202533 RepID=UPI0015AA6CBE|nr:uncharacterized protein LOC118185664 [Stegodyphus dumicola]
MYHQNTQHTQETAAVINHTWPDSEASYHMSKGTINLTKRVMAGNIQCIQVNLQKAQAAMAQVRKFAIANNADLIFIQEPYTRNGRVAGFPLTWTIFQKEDILEPPREAIVNCNPNWSPSILAATRDQVAILLEVENFIIMLTSIYSSPTDDLEATIAFLDATTLPAGSAHQLHCGDFNAHSTNWGYATTDPKGRLLEDYISSKNLVILNTSDITPTFDRIFARGWPDLAIATVQTVHLVQNWVVREDSLSDHKYITFEIAEHTTVPVILRFNSPGRKIKKLSKNMHNKLLSLKDHLYSTHTPEALEDLTDAIIKGIQDTCKELLPQRSTKNYIHLTGGTVTLGSSRRNAGS